MKILVSWIAWYHDFDLSAGDIGADSPNFGVHTTGFAQAYDLHLILSPAEEGDTRSSLLHSRIRREFPTHGVRMVYYPLSDIFDFREIRSKVDQALAPYHEAEIDILFSTGTTPMRMVWVLLHLEQNTYHTRLVQSLDRQMSRSSKVSYRFIALKGSTVGQRLDAVEVHRDRRPYQYVSPFLQPVYAEAADVARVNQIPVLIQGPSGSGKELLARYVHDESGRSAQPFIPVNCAAIGAELLESRLFGYRKGAFTGATENRKGLFEDAEEGTLFLDEIGDISPYMQQALLRVLQEGEITRVGDSRARRINVRIIAATNKDLLTACQAGQFRWDLYYRLAVVELHLPAFVDYPQAEREDFINAFINRRRSLARDRQPLRLAPEVKAWLLSYTFPGNLRELDSLITRLYVFSEGEKITQATLDRVLRHRKMTYSLSLEDVEQAHIRRVLAAHDYVLSQTARALGIALNTLKSKLQRYGIERPETSGA